MSSSPYQHFLGFKTAEPYTVWSVLSKVNEQVVFLPPISTARQSTVKEIVRPPLAPTRTAFQSSNSVTATYEAAPDENTEAKKRFPVINNNTTQKTIGRKKKYSHIGPRTTEIEIAKFLERKKEREEERIRQIERLELEELSMCTFKPRLLSRKSMRSLN
jgi:hypothetical protein